MILEQDVYLVLDFSGIESPCYIAHALDVHSCASDRLLEVQHQL